MQKYAKINTFITIYYDLKFIYSKSHVLWNWKYEKKYTFVSDLYDMNPRMGKLKDITKFDGPFFGIMTKVGDWIDPHSRILLETTYEAICDAGIRIYKQWIVKIFLKIKIN